MITYFVVQTFTRTQRGLVVADEPSQVPSRSQAEHTAARLAASKAGVIAFARSGDPSSGEWQDAVILCSYGHVPAADQLEAQMAS